MPPGQSWGLYTEFKGFAPLISCRGPQSLVKLMMSGEPACSGAIANEKTARQSGDYQP